MADDAFGHAFGRRADELAARSQGWDPGRTLGRVLDWATLGHFRVVLLLVACSAIFFLPGVSLISAIDREEARFAQVSRQIVETGDFVDLRFQETAIHRPPGMYWAQALAVKAADLVGVPRAEIRISIYRLPSVAAGAAAVLLTYWTALAFVTRRAALVAALMMCSSLLLGVMSRLATADTGFLLFAIAAMGAAGRAYLSWQRGDGKLRQPLLLSFVFWTSLACGVLTKGPLVAAVILLPMIVLAIHDRSAGWLLRLWPLPGLLWFIVLLLPWSLALSQRVGENVLLELLGLNAWTGTFGVRDFFEQPPGYYFVSFFLLFWPGVVLTAMATPAIWRARRQPGAQFLLAWLLVPWIVLELFPIKSPQFLLPLLPAAAILIAGVVEQRAMVSARWMQRATAWWFVLPVIGAVAMTFLSITVAGKPAFAAWPLSGLAMILGLVAWWLYDNRQTERALLNGIAASAFLFVAFFGVALANMTALFPGVDLAQAIRRQTCSRPLIVAAGYHEPSLVFLTSTSTRFTDAVGAADFLAAGTCRFAFVEQRQERAFAQRAGEIGLLYSVVTRVEGRGLAQSRPMSVAVFSSEQ